MAGAAFCRFSARRRVADEAVSYTRGARWPMPPGTLAAYTSLIRWPHRTFGSAIMARIYVYMSIELGMVGAAVYAVCATGILNGASMFLIH